MRRYSILIDTTKCVGCYECERVCCERWGLPEPGETHELSARQNTAVLTVNDVYVPRMCMHCDDPTCVSVCPVGAFEKRLNGPVVYDAEKCIGCRYCMQACPYDIPRYQWDKMNPKVMKCDMCYDRMAAGTQPACVEACPAEARSVGTFEEVRAEAERRLREDPATYYPAIYGIKEAGGTSVLYISSKPFEHIGLRTNLPDHALPDYTAAVMSKIPNYVFWSATLLGGIYWITSRRKEVQRLERHLQSMEKHQPSRRTDSEREEE